MPSGPTTNELVLLRRASVVTFAAIVITGLVASSFALAADQVMAFKGTITSYSTGGSFVEIPDVPVGSTVRGQVLYDDTTVDVDGSPNEGQYPVTTFALGFDGTSDLHIGITATADIKIKNDLASGPDFIDEIRIETGSMLVPSVTMSVATLAFRINEVSTPAPTVLASDALPATLPALSSFSTEQALSVIGYLPASDVTQFDATITDFGPVGSPDLPLIPDSVVVETDGTVVWSFTTLGISLCVSGCWVDPPAASGFTYRMSNAELFTGIVDFPTGFGTAIEVSVGGSTLGTFGPGDSVDFTGFPGGGVPEFQITGIIASTSSAEGFPLNLSVTSTAAAFSMTSIVASVPALGLGGMLALGGMLSLVGFVMNSKSAIRERLT